MLSCPAFGYEPVSHMLMASVCPLLNRGMPVVPRQALHRRKGVTLLPPLAFLLIQGITFMAEDVPIILRVIPVPAVHHVADALCRLSASIAGHVPSPLNDCRQALRASGSGMAKTGVAFTKLLSGVVFIRTDPMLHDSVKMVRS